MGVKSRRNETDMSGSHSDTQATNSSALPPQPPPQNKRRRAWRVAVGLLMVVHLALGARDEAV